MDGQTVPVGGRVDVSGTPIQLTVVNSGSIATEAIVGAAGGAQTTVPVTFPTGSAGVGGAIISGLNGPSASPTGNGTFTGAAPAAVGAVRSESLLGLVVAAVVGMVV